MATTVYTVTMRSESDVLPFNKVFRTLHEASLAVAESAVECGYTAEDCDWEQRMPDLTVCVYNNFGEICEYYVKTCDLD